MMASVPTVAPSVFISYRRAEAVSEFAAGWLFERLVEHLGEGRVFKDVDSIQLGDDFVELISAAVASCDVLLALIGRQWLTITNEDGQRRLDDPDDFVRLEIETALTRNVLAIPILIGGARMPRVKELPPSLAKLVRRQALELSPGRFGSDFRRLITVLDKNLTESQAMHAGADSKSPSQHGAAEPSVQEQAESSRFESWRLSHGDTIRQLTELESILRDFLRPINEDVRLLDANLEDAHNFVEKIRRIVRQEVLGPGGPLNPFEYRDLYDIFEATCADENDMHERYTNGLEHYKRRLLRDLSVADSDSDRHALVALRRRYIPILLAFQHHVGDILGILAE